MTTIPTEMSYASVREPGPPEMLTLASTSVPQPKPDEVLIRVSYAGVNRPDVAQREGSYPPPPDASPILGLEVAGTVVARGDDVTGVNVGGIVCALTPGGGYAEYCATPAAWCLSIPAGLTEVEAGGLPENYFTVWNNVFDRGHLQAGETFLVHGGSSGIGVAAIQLAKSFGATVYTTVGSQQKADFCSSLGADHVINYREQDFAEEVARLTGKRGVDVILDMVGGDYLVKNLKSLALDGRLLQIAFLQGSKITADLRHLMVRRLTITGSTLRASPYKRKTEIANSLREKVWPLFENKRIRPVIHQIFPLEKAAAAHALMESSQHIGKIMLEVGQ